MVRVRFAPSPTGYLHIGNARTALFNWLFARANKGKFILRVEDTDIERSKNEYFEKILEDLNWLGLNWDEGPDKGGPFAPYRQSERLEHYRKIAKQLVSEEKAYPCFCGDEDLKKRREEAFKKGLQPGYDNRCRALTKDEVKKNIESGKKYALRFKVEPKKVVVRDLIRGDVEFDMSISGDFVIMKSSGTPLFHFAVCLDDYLMKISHVIRGEDHLSNTPKHILLFEALGAKPPEFAHMSLTMAPGGVRLSKRTHAVSIAQYREKGYLPEALINYFALLGWAPADDKEVISRDDILKEFKLEKLSKSSEAFDPQKLDWMDGIYIRNTGLDELTKLAIPYLIKEKFIKAGDESSRFDEIKTIVKTVQNHLSKLSDIKDHAAVFFEDEVRIKDEIVAETIKKPDTKKVLKSLLANIEKIDKITEENFNSVLKAVQKETGIKGKALYMPVRGAITGKPHGPELRHILPILGKQKCIARIKKAIEV